jgi:hypothetical protein
MYFVMLCLSSYKQDHAFLTYEPDDPLRSWASGNRFRNDPAAPPDEQPPPEPVRATIAAGDEGLMAEFWDNPVPLMTRRLHGRLTEAGVDNLDTYTAEIREEATGRIYDDYVAFNIIGKVSAADLAKSSHDPNTGPMISKDFDSLTVNEESARGGLFFRLAESVNAILVHQSVRDHLEAAGIDTLTFLEPEQWAG